MQFVLRACFLVLLTSICFYHSYAESTAKVELHGAGWYQFGRIMHSSDTLVPDYNYNDNWISSAGSQFTIHADISEELDAAIGLGGYQLHNAQGARTSIIRARINFYPYLTEARVTYYPFNRDNNKLFLNSGLFAYQYNRDTRNLGSYLFRGPVYPGFLFSEFEAKSLDTTVANIIGFQLHSEPLEGFSNDLIFRSETELPPVFDISLAYISSYKIMPGVEIGAGVNFYRLIPANSKVTKLDEGEFKISTLGTHPYDGDYGYYIDFDTTYAADSITVENIDTTTIRASHQGIKLMGRFSIDLNTLTQLNISKSFKLYSEVALLGIKDYEGIYPNKKERIPVMFGMYLPVPWLDEAVVEAEWYGAKYKNDYQKLYKSASPIPKGNPEYDRTDSSGYVKGTTIPFSDPYDVTNMTKDNIKWSLYLTKSFMTNTKISLQIANDHYRPFTHYFVDPTGEATEFSTAFTTLKDWYAMMKIGYNF